MSLRIPDEVLDSVFYIYPTMSDAKLGNSVGGCGFVVGIQSELFPDRWYTYAVTAAHVITESKGKAIIRVNTQDGGFEYFDTSNLWEISDDDFCRLYF